VIIGNKTCQPFSNNVTNDNLLQRKSIEGISENPLYKKVRISKYEYVRKKRYTQYHSLTQTTNLSYIHAHSYQI
jgi:hypothetical protein